MPCTPIVEPTPPSLPSPFSVTPPALPPTITGAGVCCTKPPFSLPPSPLPPFGPGILSPSIIAAINQAESIVRAYGDQLLASIPCPGE